MWRLPEWLFPRFDGDPGALGAGGHWQGALHPDEIVYIWCVTLGVVPLLVIARAALRRDFWTGPRAWLAAFGGVSLLLAFGNALPFFRSLYAIEALRRLRYPIKFYLLTTLCAALLAGFAADRLEERPVRRRERLALVAVFALFAAAVLISGEGGLLDRLVAPHLDTLRMPADLQLPAIRSVFRGDALFGILAAAVVAAAASLRPGRPQGYLLGFATLAFAFTWGLPLFVSSDEKDLARQPALVQRLEGPGRLYVDPSIAGYPVLPHGTAHAELPPLVSRLARVQVEELFPATGAVFSVRTIFDADPDGSYGWFSRLAGEALSASTPEEKSRLLRAFGARWVLAEEATPYPQFHSVTGFSVAGHQLALSELPDPLPELRWAGSEIKAASLSGALQLLRGASFHPDTEVDCSGNARTSRTVSLSRCDRRARNARRNPRGPRLGRNRGLVARPPRLRPHVLPLLEGDTGRPPHTGSRRQRPGPRRHRAARTPLRLFRLGPQVV